MKACLYKSLFCPILGVVLILTFYFALNGLGIFIATGMFFVGAGLVVSYGYWRYLMSQPIYLDDFKRYTEHLSKRRHASQRLASLYFVFLALIFILLMVTERLTQTSMGEKTWWQEGVIGTNGIWENSCTLLLLITIILYWRYAFWIRESPSRLPSLAIVLFTLMIVVILGEETDWGQVWFHFATPDSIYSRSVEGTFALHELTIYDIDFNSLANIAVHVILFCYGVLLPILVFLFADVSYAADQLRIPLPHVAFSFWALLTLLLEVNAIGVFFMGKPYDAVPWSVSEIRETILYCLFFGGVLYSTLFWKAKIN